jgi:predicted AlkP superfamily pyrophosphatase or phosphodiesterase
MKFTRPFFVRLAPLWIGLYAFPLSIWSAPKVGHVFIVSIDGGKPDVINQSEMPVLERLAKEGAFTWTAQTVFPSLTLPSHTSMLTGLRPEKHQVLWNTWKPEAGVVKVPTIFSYAKEQGFSTAMFVGKEKFRHLVGTGTVDKFDFDLQNAGEVVSLHAGESSPASSETVLARTVAKHAAAYIQSNKPSLCFIHFTDPDDAGHLYGWGSEQQRRAFSDVDAALGEVLKGIEKGGLLSDSVLIITADHGGHGRTHGSALPEDINIPWIAWGKPVKRNYRITSPVSTCDTAATVLWLLAVHYSESLDGKPVKSAFSEGEDSITSPTPTKPSRNEAIGAAISQCYAIVSVPLPN